MMKIGYKVQEIAKSFLKANIFELLSAQGNHCR